MLYGSLRGFLTPITSRFINGERFIMPAIHHKSLLTTENEDIDAAGLGDSPPPERDE
jgi:hypothetical protein